MRKHERIKPGRGARIADLTTAFVGSWLFLFLHLIWFAAWIGLRVEPFPFGLLTMAVSLEAIALSTIVMISQNKQSERDHVQINRIEALEQMLDEHVNTTAKEHSQQLREVHELVKAVHGRLDNQDVVIDKIMQLVEIRNKPKK